MDTPLHPALVHFPIALIASAFFFQALYLWKLPLICRTMSMWLLGLGALLSLPATISGQEDAVYAGQSGLETIVLETIQRHELMANLTTWGSLIVVITWVYLFLNNPQDKRIDRLALAFLGLLTGLVLFTGYLGGVLSFGYGVGMAG
jgi:uncharacterized membrane protein